MAASKSLRRVFRLCSKRTSIGRDRLVMDNIAAAPVVTAVALPEPAELEPLKRGARPSAG